MRKLQSAVREARLEPLTAGPQLALDLRERQIEAIRQASKEVIEKLKLKPSFSFKKLPGYKISLPEKTSFVLLKDTEVVFFSIVSHPKLVGLPMVRQTLLWRDDWTPELRGVASAFVFNKLLKEYLAISSDRLQTEAGKRFWITLVTKALSLKKHVHVYDKRSSELTEFFDLSDFRNAPVWGRSKEWKKVLIVISNRPLM